MTRKEKFVQQLNNLERIEISSFHQKRTLLLRSVIFTLFIFHSILAIYLFPSFLALGILGISFISLVLLILKMHKSISSAAIKGDSLILKNAQNKNCVTSIKSIRKMKAKRIGGTTITSFQYHLDGSKRKAILLSNTNGSIEPFEAIRSAQRIFKK